MSRRPVVAMVMVVVTPVAAGKVPMMVVVHQRGGGGGGGTFSFSLSEYARGVAIPRARTKYLTLTIGETHARAPLPGLLAGSKTSAPPVICIPLTSHRGVCHSLSLSRSAALHGVSSRLLSFSCSPHAHTQRNPLSFSSFLSFSASLASSSRLFDSPSSRRAFRAKRDAPVPSFVDIGPTSNATCESVDE